MRSWARSRWLDLTLSLIVASVEAASLAPWLRLLGHRSAGADLLTRAPVGLFLVGLLSFWSARALLNGDRGIAAVRAGSLGLWLVAMLLWAGLALNAGFATPLVVIERLSSGDTTVYVLLGLGVLAWWRGLALGSDPEPFIAQTIRRAALRAALLIGSALLIATLANEPTARAVTDSSATALPVALVGSLVAAAAVQVRDARARARAAGEHATGFGWLGAAFGLAVGMLAVAVMLAGIAGRDIWAQILRPLDALTGVIGTVIYWAFVAVIYIIFLVLEPLIWLLQRLAGQDRSESPQPDLGPSGFDQFTKDTNQAFPVELRILLEVGLGVAIALLILWLVLRSLRHYQGLKDRQSVDEVRESVWSRELGLEQLRSLFPNLHIPRRRPARRHVFDLDVAPRDVRDAYRHLLVLAGRLGAPRSPAETPADYVARLEARWPELTESLGDLTDRYVHARYGNHRSDQDAAQAAQDWEAICRRTASDDRPNEAR